MRAHRYRITIEGDLGWAGFQEFEEFEIEASGGRTSLIADLDQAALHGALIRLRSLGFQLMELARISNEVG